MKAGDTPLSMSFSLFLVNPLLNSDTPGSKESISCSEKYSPIILDASFMESLVIIGSIIFSKKAPKIKVQTKIKTVEMPDFFIMFGLFSKIRKLIPFFHFTFVYT
jgi:hypothetical protein